MIKINLLPQRRAKKHSLAPDVSAKPLVFGALGIVAAAALVFVLFDQPKRRQLAELTLANQQLQTEIAAKNKQLEGYLELKKASDEADERYKAIERLLSAKVVPAHVLHELGEILGDKKYPTMTEDMIKRTGNGPDSDANKRFQGDWDASHVWLSGFADTAQGFKLEGGAQSENDVAQLAKRLAASVYFTEVTPAGGERVADTATGTNYYRFTITGKVVY
jgi:Tfp pilus assembly protein PilN